MFCMSPTELLIKPQKIGKQFLIPPNQKYEYFLSPTKTYRHHFHDISSSFAEIEVKYVYAKNILITDLFAGEPSRPRGCPWRWWPPGGAGSGRTGWSSPALGSISGGFKRESERTTEVYLFSLVTIHYTEIIGEMEKCRLQGMFQ